MKKLADIELGPMATVPPTASIFMAAHEMRKARANVAIVMGADETIEAVITEQDIVWGLDLHGADFLGKKVGEHILHKPLVCELSESVVSAAKLMIKHRIRHLPVTRAGKLVGMAGILDILVALDLAEILEE